MLEQWKVVKKVLDDLIADWDPIELSSVSPSTEWNLNKEYDVYTTALAGMIIKGCTKEELVSFLYFVESDQMGVIPSKVRIEKYLTLVLERLKEEKK
jgi:hypothetical protein